MVTDVLEHARLHSIMSSTICICIYMYMYEITKFSVQLQLHWLVLQAKPASPAMEQRALMNLILLFFRREISAALLQVRKG